MKRLRQRWQAFLLRRHPIEARTLTLVHKRIYIVPAGKGWGFALLLLISLIGATNYQLSLGFFFSFLLLGIGHAALLRTYAALLGLALTSLPAAPVFAGELARFPLRLGDSRGRARPGIVLLSPDGACAEVDVPAGAQAVIEARIPAMRRGVLPLPRCRIECRTPSGWFVAWSYITLASDCLVYPCPEINPPPLPVGAYSGRGSMQAGDGDDDFAGLREYQPGDSPRRIAWKQLARSDQVLSKTYQSPLASEVILDWRTLAGLETEARLSRLCAWILGADAGGLRYGLILPGCIFEPDQGSAHRAACLAALAQFPMNAELSP